MSIMIKGHSIASYKPTICVPVMGKDKAQLIDEVKKCLCEGAYLIEWRADFYEELLDKDSVCETLKAITSLDENLILLFTIRSVNQGGKGMIDKDYLKELLLAIASTGQADLIDLEYVEYENVDEMISLLQSLGTKVVTSHHNFAITPAKDEMSKILNDMRMAGADIVKLAVMPNTRSDVIDLLDITREFSEKYDVPVITMSMGSLGQISRVAGATFGSCVSFACVGEASAPGQLEFNEAKNIIEILGR